MLENIFKILNDSVYFQNIVVCNEPFKQIITMWKNLCHDIFSCLLSKIETSVLLKNIFSLYKS